MNDARSTALARFAATRHSTGLLVLMIVCCPMLASTAAGQSPNHRQRTVYTCHEKGITVLSDRPCGPLAVTRTVTTEEPPPGTSATTTPPAPRAAVRPRVEQVPVSEARPDRGTTDRCATLQRELTEVDDRMRAGYTAREAARLWDRRRDLKDRLRRERC